MLYTIIVKKKPDFARALGSEFPAGGLGPPGGRRFWQSENILCQNGGPPLCARPAVLKLES
jgi:hypothetical protein